MRALSFYEALCLTCCSALYIIGERDQPYVIGDQTWFQHEVTLTCDNTDNGGAGSSYEFFVWETRANSEPIMRRVRVTCYVPVIEYTHDIKGWTCIYTINGEYRNCLTAFSQDNLTTDSVPLYAAEGPRAGQGRRLYSLDDGTMLTHERQLLQSTPVVRMAKNFVNSITFGIGSDILCMTGLSFLGGCGDGGIDEALKAIQQQLHDLTNFTEHAKDWMHIADQRFMNIEDFERIAAAEFERQRSSIGQLSIQTQELWQFQRETAIYMNEGFTQFKQELIKNQDTLSSLFGILMDLHNRTDQQLLELTRAQQGLGQMLESFMVQQFQQYQGKPSRRAMTAMWHDNERVAFVPAIAFPENQFNVSNPAFLGTSHKMLGPPRGQPARKGGPDWGIPPRPGGFAGTKNIEYAVRKGPVAWTNVLLTEQTSPNVRRYYAYAVRYYCDEEFTTNRVLPTVQLKALFGRIGPKNCQRTTDWTCNCVVQWTTQQSREIDSRDSLYGKIWPFDYDKALNLRSAAIPGLTFQEVVADLITTKEEYIDALNRAFCKRQQAIVTKVLVSGQSARAYRVTSNEVDAIWDLPLAQDDPTSCADLYTSGPSSNGVAQTIYRAWQTTFAIKAKTQFQGDETQVYGTIPSRLDPVTVPWTIDPVRHINRNTMHI